MGGFINKEEFSIEQQNKRFSEENPLGAIKRILLCFMSLSLAEDLKFDKEQTSLQEEVKVTMLGYP